MNKIEPIAVKWELVPYQWIDLDQMIRMYLKTVHLDLYGREICWLCANPPK